MINMKLLKSHMKLYRHETFITSFFAFITSLIILAFLILFYGLDVSAQSVSGSDNGGSDWEFDDSELTSITEHFDFSYNGPVLNYNDSPFTEYERLVGLYGSQGSYNFNFDNSNYKLPNSWTYGDVVYNLSDYKYFIFCAGSSGQNSRIVISKSNDFSIAKNPLTGQRSGNISSVEDTFVFNIVPNSRPSGIGKFRQMSSDLAFGHGEHDIELYYGHPQASGCGFSNANIPFELRKVGNGPDYPIEFVTDGDANYLLDQLISNGVFKDPNDSSNETADNNLVIDGSDWIFKNSKYSAPYNSSINTGDIYPNGSITFQFDPTSYQTNHPEEFYLTFTFYMDYSVTYKNWTGASDPFQETNKLLNNTKTYSHVYDYSDNDISYLDVPLSEFISNGNSKSWTWKDIFDKLDNFSSVLLRSKEITEISYNKFNLYCTAFINYNNKSSGYYTEWYNPMSKKGLTTDTSGTINKDPYNGDNNNDPDSSNTPDDTNAPGEGGNNGGNNSSSSTSSTGSIVINNNPTFNNNSTNTNNLTGDSGNTFNNLVQSMVGDNNITSENIADTTGTNGFIQFMNNTFSFVPSSFYTALLGFFVTTLAILVIAFVLRIILDLL